MSVDYLEKILNAQVYDVADETPLELASNLSTLTQNKVLLKREDLQPVFSFKLRGAYNKIASLSAAQLDKGVICASAGNHAQGVALSAYKLGCKAVIVMPNTTPQIKIDSVHKLGGKQIKVILHGNNFDEASAHALGLSKKHNYSFVHPFDDPDVIAGQGTVAMEILRQYSRNHGEIHAIFCSIGGGGLISGVAAYIKRLQPKIKIIGVEAYDAASMKHSLEAGKRVSLDHVGLFADGAAVKQVGVETFRLCQQYVDEIVCVDTDAICASIKSVFEDTRSILEPAGAMAVAGLREYVRQNKITNKNLIAVTSGANVNFNRLRFVAERAEIGEHKEALLAVSLPEQPGAYKQFLKHIGKRSITEFNYRYHEARAAHVFVGVQVENRAESQELVSLLKSKGYPAIDLSDDEMAKLHIRHLVGGHAPQAEHETLFRFEFPDSPGALINFLQQMSAGWNISLFHYRNHGADVGRVLVGMQVPEKDREKLKKFIKTLGYPHWDETENPAYKLFLS